MEGQNTTAATTPATSAAQPAAETVSTTPAQTPSATSQPVSPVVFDNDAADDAAFDSVSKGGKWETASERFDAAGQGKVKPQTPATDTTAPEPEQPALTATDSSQPATDLTEDDKQVLRRFQLEDADAPAKPESRRKFLDNLRTRAADQDRLFRENAEYRRSVEQATSQQQQPAQTQTQQQPPQGDHWAAVMEYMGKEGVEPLQRALQVEYAPMAQHAAQQDQQIQNLNQQLAALAPFVFEGLIEKGFGEATFPEGIDASKPEHRKAVQDEAHRLILAERQRLGDQFDLQKFNFRHAIPKAVSLVFNQQIQDAQKKQAEERRKTALRGTPDPGTRTPTTQRAMTEEERDDALLDAQKSGDRERFKQLASV